MGALHQDLQNDRIYKRALQVRTMRLAGFTYQQIATKHKISVDTVRRDLERINVEFPEMAARQIVAEQDAQLVEMFRPFFLKAVAGNDKAANTALKIMEHRARLFNLFDLPQDAGQKAAEDKLNELMRTIGEAAVKIGRAHV